jgi:hypothetical protein
VSRPELYEWYSSEEVISFFGAYDDEQSFCNGQWLVFPTTLVCLTEIDETNTRQEATKSHFKRASQFCWIADQQYRGPDGEPHYFVPSEAISGVGEKRAIELFVRPPEARRYLYAGQLARSHTQSFPARQGFASASFHLKQTLPSSVWIELGGLRLGDLDHASVDAALERLRQPTTVHDRLSILERLVNYWHGPIRPEDGMSDAEIGGLPLPMPLRWWYRWAGKRWEILGRQNRLLVPRDFERRYGMLRINNGRLCFYDENQGVYAWSTLRDGDDPPVFGRYEGKGRWAKERTTLSEHLILACLCEAIMGHANYGASAAWLDEDQLAELIERIPSIALGPWRWLGLRFFARQGAFMCAAINGEMSGKKEREARGKKSYSVWVGAKTEHPLQFLKPFLNDKWEYISV